jgi:hypothetical protein
MRGCMGPRRVFHISLKNSEFRYLSSNSQDIPYFLPVPTTIVSENGRECLTGVIERILALGIKGYPFVKYFMLK